MTNAKQKRAMISEPVKVQPGTGWVWVSNTNLIINGMIYARGCVIPDDVLNATPNFEALRDNRRVKQTLNANTDIKPVPVEASQTTLTLAQAVVADAADAADHLERWELSLVLTMEASNCVRAVAVDLLCADAAGARLYMQASRLASERNAIGKAMNGRRPHVAI